MRLITWNVQWCRGVDGRVDPARIVDHARRLGDFDVLCLQEIASNFPMLGGSAGEDQFGMLAALLPGFTRVDGVAVDIPDGRGGRRLFGNMILSRLPVLRVIRHALPWPVEDGVKSMPRVLIEASVEAKSGPLRILTTHFEFHSVRQRAAQVEAVRAAHAEACASARGDISRTGDAGTYAFLARPEEAILTADFNMRPADPLLARLAAPFGDGAPAFRDAWRIAHAGADHPHTAGVHDHVQWPEPHACDFIYVTDTLAARVVDCAVDLETAASDHQPVMLTLDF